MNRRNVAWSFGSVLATLLAGCGDGNNRLLDAGGDDLGVIDVPSTDRGGAGDLGAADTGLDVALDRATAADDGHADVLTDTVVLDSRALDVPADRASVDAPDVRVADAGASDAQGTDVTDVVVADRALADVIAADAGRARGTPVIDGVIGSDWPSGAIVVTNAVPSTWGPALNALRSIRVAWDSNRLYLGLDGVVEASNAMVVFIDRDFVPATTATGVTAPSMLTDGMGSLDNSISCNVTESPPGFGADMVWGTRGMLSRSASDLNDAIGLRDVGCTACRADFRWTTGDTAVCVGGATPACEVAIDWNALYGGPPPPVPMLGLFMRITDAEGAQLDNNQCLPEQAIGDLPTTARRVLSFSPNL